ncbi:conserved protein of unknown function [Pseudomonas sp. JV241A]|nr:conserved protein of unknown function [Pseudomonas sp. JV241A]
MSGWVLQRILLAIEHIFAGVPLIAWTARRASAKPRNCTARICLRRFCEVVVMSQPRPEDDPLWKDPLNNPQREHDPVTDPNVPGEPQRRDQPQDIERLPDAPDQDGRLPEPDQPTPLSDERR